MGHATEAVRAACFIALLPYTVGGLHPALAQRRAQGEPIPRGPPSPPLLLHCAAKAAPSPFVSRPGLKILITRFADALHPTDSQAFEAGLGSAIQTVLPQYIRSQVEPEAHKYSPAATDVQAAYVPCVVTTHSDARAAGRAYGADLVLWGSTEPKGDKVSSAITGIFQSSLRGANNASRNFIQAGAGATLRLDARQTFNVQLPAELTGVSFKTALTFVNWRTLAPSGPCGLQASQTPALRELDFPQLASEWPLALLHFLIGVHAYRSALYTLALSELTAAQDQFEAGGRGLPELYWLVGVSSTLAGRLPGGRAAFAQGLRSCPVGNSRCQATALHHIAWGYQQQGELRNALAQYQQALLLRQLDDKSPGASETQLQLGRLHEDLGDPEKSLAAYQQAATGSEQAHDPYGSADAWLAQGLLYQNRGEGNMAHKAYARSRKLGADADDAVAQAAAATNRGTIHEEAGQLQEALAAYQEALALTEELADRAGQARVLVNLGRSAAKHGEVARAAVAWQRAQTLYLAALHRCEQARDLYGQTRVLVALADLYLDRGTYAQALEQAERAQALSEQVGDRDGRAAALERLGRVHRAMGDKAKARSAYQLALQLVEPADRGGARLAILQQLGEVHVALGEADAALDAFGRALKLSQAAQRRSTQLQLLSAMRELSLKSPDSKGAPGLYQQAATLYEQLGDVTKQIETLRESARVLSRTGDGPGAITAYKHALALSAKTQRAESSGPAGSLLVELAQTQRRFGDAAGALATYQLALDSSRQATDTRGQAALLSDIGQLRCTLGAAAEGLRLVQQALDFVAQADEPSWQRSLWLTMAGCHSKNGDPQRAREAMQSAEALRTEAAKRGGSSTEMPVPERPLAAAEQALTLSRRLGSKSWEADVLVDYGDAQLGLGRTADALAFYHQALSLCQQIGDRQREARTHERLGGLYSQNSEVEPAIAAYRQALVLFRSSGSQPDQDRVARLLQGLMVRSSTPIINRVRQYLKSRPEQHP